MEPNNELTRINQNLNGTNQVDSSQNPQNTGQSAKTSSSRIGPNTLKICYEHIAALLKGIYYLFAAVPSADELTHLQIRYLNRYAIKHIRFGALYENGTWNKLPLEKRLALVRNIAFMTEIQIQEIVNQEQEEPVIREMLAHLKPNDFSLNLKKHTSNTQVSNAISLGRVKKKREAHEFNQSNWNYTYKYGSSLSEEILQFWTTHASGEQIFAILMKTESFEHIHWALEILSCPQKEYIVAQASTFAHDAKDFSFSRKKDFLTELTKVYPALLRQIALKTTLNPECLAQVLFFCDKELKSKLLENYVNKATNEQINSLLSSLCYYIQGSNLQIGAQGVYVKLFSHAYDLSVPRDRNYFSKFSEKNIFKPALTPYFARVLLNHSVKLSAEGQSIKYFELLREKYMNTRNFSLLGPLIQACYDPLTQAFDENFSGSYKVAKNFDLKKGRQLFFTQFAKEIVLDDVMKHLQTTDVFKLIPTRDMSLDYLEAFFDDLWEKDTELLRNAFAQYLQKTYTKEKVSEWKKNPTILEKGKEKIGEVISGKHENKPICQDPLIKKFVSKYEQDILGFTLASWPPSKANDGKK